MLREVRRDFNMTFTNQINKYPTTMLLHILQINDIFPFIGYWSCGLWSLSSTGWHGGRLQTDRSRCRCWRDGVDVVGVGVGKDPPWTGLHMRSIGLNTGTCINRSHAHLPISAKHNCFYEYITVTERTKHNGEQIYTNFQNLG